jgi:hypothetical protein
LRVKRSLYFEYHRDFSFFIYHFTSRARVVISHPSYRSGTGSDAPALFPDIPVEAFESDGNFTRLFAPSQHRGPGLDLRKTPIRARSFVPTSSLFYEGPRRRGHGSPLCFERVEELCSDIHFGSSRAALTVSRDAFRHVFGGIRRPFLSSGRPMKFDTRPSAAPSSYVRRREAPSFLPVEPREGCPRIDHPRGNS